MLIIGRLFLSEGVDREDFYCFWVGGFDFFGDDLIALGRIFYFVNYIMYL